MSRCRCQAWWLAAAVLALAAGAHAKKPRDYLFHPQPAGTTLRVFGFFGPGLRATIDTRAPLEQDMSELQAQLTGDANYGYSEASLSLDVRVFLLALGASAGYRNDWHLLQFEPDTLDPRCPDPSEPCLDHGERRLTRRARWLKDHDYDWDVKGWPWYEGRVRILAPMDPWIGISTLQIRFQHRGLERQTAYDWPNATVFDDGLIFVSETFLVLRSRRHGFAGPALRVLEVPRGHDEGDPRREWEVHYGVLAGTQTGPNNDDTVLLRVYTTLGQDEDLMGVHAYRAPIQVVLGYQASWRVF
jgi:hypothetical protein